ncbi:MAG TPA: carbon storage regulator [Firmicutes bacterium]|nr:carbon storage regulator [Bacillota bacterium]
MLVITRKLHQSLFIGDSVRVTILEVRNGEVRLGIDAPRDMSVLREEIIRSLAYSNYEACANSLPGTEALGDMLALLRLRDGTCPGDDRHVS